MPRESCAIIKFRKLGYTINHIADFLGRSTSFVFKRIETARERGLIKNVWGIPKLDKRKMPHKQRLRSKWQRFRMLEKLRDAWEKWILGEEGDPP